MQRRSPRRSKIQDFLQRRKHLLHVHRLFTRVQHNFHLLDRRHILKQKRTILPNTLNFIKVSFKFQGIPPFFLGLLQFKSDKLHGQAPYFLIKLKQVVNCLNMISLSDIIFIKFKFFEEIQAGLLVIGVLFSHEDEAVGHFHCVCRGAFLLLFASCFGFLVGLADVALGFFQKCKLRSEDFVEWRRGYWPWLLGQVGSAFPWVV